MRSASALGLAAALLSTPTHAGERHRDGHAVAQAVHRQATARLGSRWADTAVRLAKVESGWRCHVRGPKTRVGRAVGPLQIMPGSARALGFIDMKRLQRDCAYQIAAGVEHMALCIRSGVRTGPQMAACHVAGVGGWNRRLNRSAEAYKRQYIRMADLGRLR
jgi:hypothetical protein